MGNGLWPFERELNIIRCVVAPALENLTFEMAIEGRIDLDRIEVTGIMGEPLLLLKTLNNLLKLLEG
jgi:hypothetical protein